MLFYLYRCYNAPDRNASASTDCTWIVWSVFNYVYECLKGGYYINGTGKSVLRYCQTQRDKRGKQKIAQAKRNAFNIGKYLDRRAKLKKSDVFDVIEVPWDFIDNQDSVLYICL